MQDPKAPNKSSWGPSVVSAPHLERPVAVLVRPAAPSAGKRASQKSLASKIFVGRWYRLPRACSGSRPSLVHPGDALAPGGAQGAVVAGVGAVVGAPPSAGACGADIAGGASVPGDSSEAVRMTLAWLATQCSKTAVVELDRIRGGSRCRGRSRRRLLWLGGRGGHSAGWRRHWFPIGCSGQRGFRS
jgi:hypothetical protein